MANDNSVISFYSKSKKWRQLVLTLSLDYLQELFLRTGSPSDFRSWEKYGGNHKISDLFQIISKSVNCVWVFVLYLQIRKLIFLDMTFERLHALLHEIFEGRNITELSADEVLVMVHSQMFGMDKALVYFFS